MNYYEIYDKKSGEILAKGNARECRAQLGCASIDSFYALVKNASNGKAKKYTVYKCKGGETDYPVIK